jgi:hypothetical protein
MARRPDAPLTNGGLRKGSCAQPEVLEIYLGQRGVMCSGGGREKKDCRGPVAVRPYI